MYHLIRGQMLLPKIFEYIFWPQPKLPKSLCILDCLRGQNVDVAKSQRHIKPTWTNVMVLTLFG